MNTTTTMQLESSVLLEKVKRFCVIKKWFLTN